jgi:hypothetical protein
VVNHPRRVVAGTLRRRVVADTVGAARHATQEGNPTMKMERKATSTRKPPVPSDSHAEIDDWMRRIMPDLQPIVTRLDEMIRGALPDLQYAIKWKKAYYGVPDRGWVIELVAYDVSVNVVFLGGADFDSPPPLGDSDRSRYIKVKSLDEVEHPDVLGWIENAGRVPGWT